MARKDRSREILVEALNLAEAKKMHANHALLQSMSNIRATDDERNTVQVVYADALLKIRIGHGIDYDKELLRKAIELLEPDTERPKPTTNKQQQKKKTMKEEKKMTENVNTNDSNVSRGRVGRARKYKIGDVFNTTGTFGLQPTVAKDGVEPVVGFQLSYKEKKCRERGYQILPAGSEITYIGVRQVLPNVGGKKMIFKILKGLSFDDGTVLEDDLEVAGVVSHIVDTAGNEEAESLEQDVAASVA